MPQTPKREVLVFITYFLALFCSVPNVQAQPRFLFPLSCTLDQDCWIVNYVDVDPDKDSFMDYRCGKRTYDEHNGTDIAVRDLVAMEQGIDVLAAQDGTVLRFRDEIEDRMPSASEIEQMHTANKDCGNGVFINHGDGWQTIYCHMKQGSITVKADQEIKAGEKIGRLGHSGIAEFPHLHFGVFFEGHTIDPFTGKDDAQGCGQASHSLWRNNYPEKYSPFAIYTAGFRGTLPDAHFIDSLKIDTTSPGEISGDGDAIIFWMGYFGAQKGDEIHLEIVAPDGRITAQKTNMMEKDRARQFYYIGKPMRSDIISGTYTGTASVTRKTTEDSPETQKILRSISVGSSSLSAQ